MGHVAVYLEWACAEHGTRSRVPLVGLRWTTGLRDEAWCWCDDEFESVDKMWLWFGFVTIPNLWDRTAYASPKGIKLPSFLFRGKMGCRRGMSPAQRVWGFCTFVYVWLCVDCPRVRFLFFFFFSFFFSTSLEVVFVVVEMEPTTSTLTTFVGGYGGQFSYYV